MRKNKPHVMFSSLLSKPKHSSYTKAIQLDPTTISNSKVLILPTQKSNETVIDNPNAKDGTISKYYLNDDGTLNYNLTISSANTDKKFHSSYIDTIPLKQRFPNLKHNFPKLNKNDELVRDCIRETKLTIHKILQEKLGEATNKNDNEFINYNSQDVNERGRERIIQIKNYAADPMLPPKHKLRKNVHKEPSPPPPILKNSKAVKLSKEEKDNWKIPSLISNWKNDKGFIISLDKRVMSTQTKTPELNIKKLNDLSSALDQADKQAREEIKLRNEQRKVLAEQQQIEKELKLKELAELSRNKRKFNDYHNSNKRSKGP